MDDLLREFLAETMENLAALDAGLVRLEQNPDDPELLAGIFRLMHTLKGGCGFIGLPRLERLAHAGENVLGKFRDGLLPVTVPAVTKILKSIDVIKHIIGELEKSQKEPAGNDDALIAQLNALAEGKAIPGPAAAVALPESGNVSQSIRVDIGKLENLMTTVGELVLTRNQLMQISRNQKETAFAAPLQRLNQVTSALQEGVMKTRMQPVGNVWAKLPRIVRDLEVGLGKKIDLQMHGAETGLDRQVLEIIKDPLTHMVRNAGDHGIETPADRLKAGKPETGVIRLGAWHEGGHVMIEIADDGRGLPVGKIREIALRNGLATASDLADMADEQVVQFIFKPGFSTVTQVTAVSGRGVGMDVVKTNIDKIGGVIDLQSAPGKGARFLIRIPLTLAIAPALIVESAAMRFAIPQTGVIELVQVSANDEHRIEHINETAVLRLRGRLLPLISLRTVLNDGEGRAACERFVAVMQAGDTSFGLIVDNVHDVEDIVVKPLPPLLRTIKTFSGTTILGDGNIIMILDPDGIAARVGDMHIAVGAASHSAAAPAMPGGERQHMLLFYAGGDAPKAVPLALVERLEEIDRRSIEYSNGTPLLQYRGKLMPLVPVAALVKMEAKGMQPVLVLNVDGRRMGLLIDRVIDIVKEKLTVDLAARRQGSTGAAILAGKATDIVDANYYLAQAYGGWFSTMSDTAPGAASSREALLASLQRLLDSAMGARL